MQYKENKQRKIKLSKYNMSIVRQGKPCQISNNIVYMYTIRMSY